MSYKMINLKINVLFVSPPTKNQWLMSIFNKDRLKKLIFIDRNVLIFTLACHSWEVTLLFH